MAKKQMAKKRASNTKNGEGSPAASFKSEVILWSILAVSIILFISNFGIAGGAGRAVSSVCFGMFGLAAYIFPILLFAETAFIISNKENKTAVVKAWASIVFAVFICMFLELTAGSRSAASPFDSYVWAAKNHFGGGFTGGLLAWIIRPHLGTVSAYVVNIAVLIICMVLMTQRSLWKHVRSGSRKVYTSAKNETIRQHEQYEARRKRRMDHKVTGVSTDTNIKNRVRPENSDNINEIHPDPAYAQDFPIHVMEQPKQEAADVLLQEQAAVGMERPPEVMPFPIHMPGAHTGRKDGRGAHADNIIPISNQKITLQPNMPEEEPKEVLKKELLEETDEASERKSPAVEAAENILADTSKLFSELLPDISDMETQELQKEAVRTEDSYEPDLSSAEDADSRQDEAEGREMEFDLPPVSGEDADSWQDEEDESEAEFDLPPVSAEELIAQQLQEAENGKVQAPSSGGQRGQSVSGTAVAAAGAGRTESSVHQGARSRQQTETAAGAAETAVQMMQAQPPARREHVLPSAELLQRGDPNRSGDSRQHLQETALKLQQTLKNFGVNVTILNVSCGPSVTRYEIQPEMGVKVSKIVNLADDIKLNLAAADIRIEAPIPGKAAIGIEVPNKENVPVMFRDLVESEEFKQQKSPCSFAAGKDIAGQAVVTDICKMPHLLIAGATGSGKSVCINTIIMSILYKADPDDVKLIMIDPKVVELSVYNGIPHLLLPVVTDPKKAAGALHWAVSEMMDRYQKFADCGVRDMKGYNAKVKKLKDIPDENKPQKMPYIVIIVDELADLMMAAPSDVEDAICRLAQLARAAGIHLIIATQRPSVNVITGLIKANMPSRIAFSVTSGIDSRTILDMNGAEKLLGKGDMLFYPQGYQKPVRVQGAFVSDSEVSSVVEFLTQQGAAEYRSDIEEKVESAASGSGTAAADNSPADDRDVYFADAAKLLIDKDKASVSMLQRYFKIGFNRAARIMDQLEEAGVVGPEEGTKPRKILMSPEEFAQYEEEVL